MSRSRGEEKPQRSCLGCRETRNKELLVRFVLSPANELVPDLDARLPGRGAYICMSASCLEAAHKQRQFNRTFRQELQLPAFNDMAGMLSARLKDRVCGLLGLANKAGKVISGGSLVEDAMRSASKPGLILLATDISGTIGDKIATTAKVHLIPCRSFMTKDEFGDILGKAPRSAVAIRQCGFVPQLVKALDRYRNFLGEV